MTQTHEPQVIVKRSSGYKLDNGIRIPPHDLHRYVCSCGWEGAASYAEESRAREHFERHVQEREAVRS